jgi:hypothetical protein
LFIYSLYGVRHSRLAGGPPARLLPWVKWLGIATALLAAGAWWGLKHPASLIVPIAMLFAFSALALSVNRRRTA